MAKFQIDISTNGEAKITSLENKVEKLDTQTKQATQTNDAFSKGLMNIAKAAVAYIAIDTLVSSITNLVTGTIDVSAKFEQFETTLKSITGSSEKAAESMAWIEDFTAKTPYELDKVTESFVKMKAYGMEPTEGMLTTLGDTAAAMGKDINQAVEAMADAITGENERLKEFGIKAKVMGEEIAYNWTNSAGETSEIIVQNNKEIIESTLGAIFNEKYAGAMDEQSKTWNGMISNIKDSWTSFQNKIMDAGLFEYLKGLAATVAEVLTGAFGEAKDGAVGFTNGVIGGIESIIMGFGHMYDAVNGIKLVWEIMANTALTALYNIQVGIDTISNLFGDEGMSGDAINLKKHLDASTASMKELYANAANEAGATKASQLISQIRVNVEKLTNAEEKGNRVKDDATGYLLAHGAVVKDNAVLLDEYGEKTQEAYYAEEMLALGLDNMGNELVIVSSVMDSHVGKYDELTKGAKDYAQALKEINAEGYGIGTNQVTEYTTVTPITSPQDYYDNGWDLPDDYYTNPRYNPYAGGQGFARGGYTGDMSTSAVAGQVHGQEYVVNAQTTKDLGLNSEGGTFKDISRKLDLLSALPELLGSMNRLLSVQKQSYAVVAAKA